jgi:hypothetical protein
MTAGTLSILKIAGIAVGSAILGAATAELGKVGIERVRYDVKSGLKKDAEGRATEYWKTWTPKTKK